MFDHFVKGTNGPFTQVIVVKKLNIFIEPFISALHVDFFSVKKVTSNLEYLT